MEEKIDQEEHLKPPAGVSGDLAGRPISFYFRLFRWPIFTALLTEIVLIIFNQPNVYLWFINLLVFIGLTVWAKQVYNLRLGQAVILGIVSGFVLGLLVSLFKLIWWHKFYLFFNIVTETTTTAMAGLLLSGGTFLMISKEYRKKEESLFNFLKKNKKGGGEDGK
ncbi:MAG: hypothetical protein ABIH38_04145 [Patescibacteria group bacterium]